MLYKYITTLLFFIMVKTTRIIAEDDNNYDKININNAQVEIIKNQNINSDSESGETDCQENKLSVQTQIFIFKKQEEFIQKTGKIQAFKPLTFEDDFATNTENNTGHNNLKNNISDTGEKTFIPTTKDSQSHDQLMKLGYWRQKQEEILKMIQYFQVFLKKLLEYIEKLLFVLGLKSAKVVKSTFYVYLITCILSIYNIAYLYLIYDIFTMKLLLLDLYLDFCIAVFFGVTLENIGFFLQLVGKNTKKQKSTLFSVAFRINTFITSFLFLYYNQPNEWSFLLIGLDGLNILGIISEASLRYALLYTGIEYVVVKLVKFLIYSFNNIKKL